MTLEMCNATDGRKLMDVVRDRIRTRHMAYRTEQAYLQWIRRYIVFHNRRHLRDLGAAEVEQFLTYLAVDRKVSSGYLCPRPFTRTATRRRLSCDRIPLWPRAMLRLTKLRELTLRAPPRPGRPCHLSAASGLVRAGNFLYVIADDENHLGVFPAAGDAPGELVRVFPGDLPDAPEARKAAKPDLEALTLLPPMPGFPAGALLALGSGSRRNRRTGALLALDASGAVVGDTRRVDLSGVMAALQLRLGKLNIEGAVMPCKQRERLDLLHRGIHPRGRNALAGVSLAAILQSPESAAGAVWPLDIRDVELGAIDGIPLCFTDGAALPDGSILFTAIAEATTDSYEDGPCVGAAIGVAGSDGTLRHLERLEKPHKIEGVDARVEGDTLRLLLVTDADDAAVPAVLYSAGIPGYPFQRRG